MSSNCVNILLSFSGTSVFLPFGKTDWFKLLHLPHVSWFQLLIALTIMVVVIWLIVRLVSRVNEDVDPAEADREMLQALNDLRREGDLTDDEFRSIKGQITSRLNTVWTGPGRPAGSAKNAVRGIAALQEKLSSTDFWERASGPDIQNSDSSESEQSETFSSPTNVPEPTQNTRDLTERRVPRSAEVGEGDTESVPDSKQNEASSEKSEFPSDQ